MVNARDSGALYWCGRLRIDTGEKEVYSKWFAEMKSRVILNFYEAKQKKRERKKSREDSQLSKNKRLQKITDTSMLKYKPKVNFVEFRKQDQIEALEKNKNGRKEGILELKYLRFYIIWKYNRE